MPATISCVFQRFISSPWDSGFVPRQLTKGRGHLGGKGKHPPEQVRRVLHSVNRRAWSPSGGTRLGSHSPHDTGGPGRPFPWRLFFHDAPLASQPGGTVVPLGASAPPCSPTPRTRLPRGREVALPASPPWEADRATVSSGLSRPCAKDDGCAHQRQQHSRVVRNGALCVPASVCTGRPVVSSAPPVIGASMSWEVHHSA